jgi:hypothetical protein
VIAKKTNRVEEGVSPSPPKREICVRKYAKLLNSTLEGNFKIRLKLAYF